jgi:hypothetical protein
MWPAPAVLSAGLPWALSDVTDQSRHWLRLGSQTRPQVPDMGQYRPQFLGAIQDGPGTSTWPRWATAPRTPRCSFLKRRFAALIGNCPAAAWPYAPDLPHLHRDNQAAAGEGTPAWPHGDGPAYTRTSKSGCILSRSVSAPPDARQAYLPGQCLGFVTCTPRRSFAPKS